MADRIHAAVEAVKTPGLHPPPDRVAVQAGLEQLRERHDSVLPRSERRDDRIRTGGCHE